jgi:hypothetical protein
MYSPAAIPEIAALRALQHGAIALPFGMRRFA